MEGRTNLEIFLDKGNHLEEFSKNFNQYSSRADVKLNLPNLISQGINVGYKTATIYISKLKNKKPFSLAFNSNTNYMKLCGILAILDEEFVVENIEYLFLVKPEFEEYYSQYVKKI
jgi:hypothetical protein